jgi:hypothetical protein
MPAGAVYPRQTATHTPSVLHTQCTPKLNHRRMLADSAAAAVVPQLPPPLPMGHSRPAQNRPNQQRSGYERSAHTDPTQPNEQSTAHPTPYGHIPSMAHYRHTNSPTAVCLGRWECIEALHMCWSAGQHCKHIQRLKAGRLQADVTDQHNACFPLNSGGKRRPGSCTANNKHSNLPPLRYATHMYTDSHAGGTGRPT